MSRRRRRRRRRQRSFRSVMEKISDCCAGVAGERVHSIQCASIIPAGGGGGGGV
jgi:hypothetical protein